MADDMTNENVEVIQADREAAAEFRGIEMNDSWGIPSLEKAFARHRLRHQLQEREAVLEEAARVAETPFRGSVKPSPKQIKFRSKIASAIRALKATPAPAVSTDEIDELLYSVTRMPLSNKAGELVRWRKATSDRLSAILSRLRP